MNLEQIFTKTNPDIKETHQHHESATIPIGMTLQKNNTMSSN